ncbi:uncharacterized protein LOC101248303 [Anopheles sinensis]|uniref:Uncharacterized protein LOC101248303 n=1 Tax=Anopheles sinensis TaxID=74873 RepID=A0A084VNL2_ANOSI|nr:uncharacterized protein LOC101248303 [Anopheles sinensis]
MLLPIEPERATEEGDERKPAEEKYYGVPAIATTSNEAERTRKVEDLCASLQIARRSRRVHREGQAGAVHTFLLTSLHSPGPYDVPNVLRTLTRRTSSGLVFASVCV